MIDRSKTKKETISKGLTIGSERSTSRGAVRSKSMVGGKLMEALKKPARRKRQNIKFNPQDPLLFEIYKEIIEYNEEKMQVKPHKVKVYRQ